MAVPSRKILFVLTSSATMGTGGKATGAWLEEFTVPYYFIRDAGLAAEVAMTAGGAVSFDPRSSGEGSEIAENRRFDSGIKLQALVKSTPSVEQVRFGNYAAIFLPGGHGTMWDLPNSIALARGVSEMFAAGKSVAAVCHGPAGLVVSATAPNGKPLVAGRWVAAFTTEEEVAVGLKEAVPFLLGERLASLGARLVAADSCRPPSPTAI
jgi:putative intracellular protease/amidase